MAKSKLTRDQVKHLAQLANLFLSTAEVSKFQKQLSAILDYVDLLNELDTQGVEPTSQVTGLENVTRPDQLTASLSPKEALSGTKSKSKGYFKIKAIFK